MVTEFKSNTVYFYSAYTNVLKDLVETGAMATSPTAVLVLQLVEGL